MWGMDDSALLTRIDAVIEARLNGDAVTEYSVGGDSFKFTPIERLYDMREKLQNRVAATSGGAFSLGVFDGRL